MLISNVLNSLAWTDCFLFLLPITCNQLQHHHKHSPEARNGELHTATCPQMWTIVKLRKFYRLSVRRLDCFHVHPANFQQPHSNMLTTLTHRTKLSANDSNEYPYAFLPVVRASRLLASHLPGHATRLYGSTQATGRSMNGELSFVEHHNYPHTGAYTLAAKYLPQYRQSHPAILKVSTYVHSWRCALLSTLQT
jgi:hypothetical protein